MLPIKGDLGLIEMACKLSKRALRDRCSGGWRREPFERVKYMLSEKLIRGYANMLILISSQTSKYLFALGMYGASSGKIPFSQTVN